MTHSQGKRSIYLPNNNPQSKGIMIGKLSLWPENMIVFVKSKVIYKLSKLISEFGKVAGHEIKIQSK